MRVHSVILVCCVLGIQVTQTQIRRLTHPNPLRIRNAALRSGGPNLVSTQLGPIILHGTVGEVPKSYKPLTKADEYATAALSSVAPDFIRRLPNVYTVNQIGPINIDLPDFWVHGKLYLNNLTVKGVNQVKLRHLEVRLRNGRVDFIIHAPHVSGDVDFEFEGHIGVVPLHLTGSVNVIIQDLQPIGAVSAKKVTLPVVGEVYQVDGGQAVIDIQNISITIKSTSGGGLDIDEDFIKNQVLNKEIKDEIGDVALSVALKELNKELAKIPAWKIDSIITESS